MKLGTILVNRKLVTQEQVEAAVVVENEGRVFLKGDG